MRVNVRAICFMILKCKNRVPQVAETLLGYSYLIVSILIIVLKVHQKQQPMTILRIHWRQPEENLQL